MKLHFDKDNYLIKIDQLVGNEYDESLNKLDLSNQNINKIDFDKLFTYTNRKGLVSILYFDLEILVLSNNNINDFKNIKCSKIYNILPKLREIHLDNNNILFLDNVKNILKFPTLELLNLSNNLITNLTKDDLNTIKLLPNFKFLNLNNNIIMNISHETLYHSPLPQNKSKAPFKRMNEQISKFCSEHRLLDSNNFTIDLQNNYLFKLPDLPDLDGRYDDFIDKCNIDYLKNTNSKIFFIRNINKIVNGYNKFLNFTKNNRQILMDDIESTNLSNIIDEIITKKKKSRKELYFNFIINSFKSLYQKELSTFDIFINLLLTDFIKININSMLEKPIGSIHNILLYKNIYSNIVKNINDYLIHLFEMFDLAIIMNHILSKYLNDNYILPDGNVYTYNYIVPKIYYFEYNNYICNPNMILSYNNMISFFNNKLSANLNNNIIKKKYYNILLYMNYVVKKYYNGLPIVNKNTTYLNHSLNLFLLLLNNIYDDEINSTEIYNNKLNNYENIKLYNIDFKMFDFSYIKYKLRMYLEKDDNYKYYLYYLSRNMFIPDKIVYIDKIFILIKKICIDIYIHKHENPIFIDYLTKLNLLKSIEPTIDTEYNINLEWSTFNYNNNIRPKNGAPENGVHENGAPKNGTEENSGSENNWEALANEVVNKPVNKPINKPINKPVNKLINRSHNIIESNRIRKYKLNMSHMDIQSIDFCLDIYMRYIDECYIFLNKSKNSLDEIDEINKYFFNPFNHLLFHKEYLIKYMDSIQIHAGHGSEILNKLVIIPRNKELYFISPFKKYVYTHGIKIFNIENKDKLLHTNKPVYFRGFNYYNDYKHDYVPLNEMKHYKEGMLSHSYIFNSILNFNIHGINNWQFSGINPVYNIFKNTNQLNFNLGANDYKNKYIKYIFRNHNNNFFTYPKPENRRSKDYIDFLFKIIFSQCDKETYKTFDQKYKYLQKNINMNLNYLLNTNKNKKCKFIINSCRSEIEHATNSLKIQLKNILKNILKLHKIIEKKKEIIKNIIKEKRVLNSANLSKLITENSNIQSKILNTNFSLSKSFIKKRYNMNNYNLYDIHRDIYDILNIYNQLSKDYKNVNVSYIQNISHGLQKMNILFQKGEMSYSDIEDTINKLLFINKIFVHRSELTKLLINEHGKKEKKGIIKKPKLFNNILKISSTNVLNKNKVTKNKDRLLKRSYSLPSHMPQIRFINPIEAKLDINNNRLLQYMKNNSSSSSSVNSGTLLHHENSSSSSSSHLRRALENLQVAPRAENSLGSSSVGSMPSLENVSQLQPRENA